MQLNRPLIAPEWQKLRKQIGLAFEADPQSAGEYLSHMVTHAPGLIYTPDSEQAANPETGLPGGQPEAVRSHHAALLRGERPRGDCDDFTETGVNLLYLAGVDARRIVKVIVADEGQFLRGTAFEALRVSHIVGGLYLGPLPADGNVAKGLAKDPGGFAHTVNLFDTWEQSRPPAQHNPRMRQSRDGLYNRHMPLSVQGLATGLTEYAVTGCEAILRRSGLLSEGGDPVPRTVALSATPPPGDRPAEILFPN